MDEIFSKDYDHKSSEGLEFKLNDDKCSYTVIGIGSCTEQNITIDTYEGLPVTDIADNAFEMCDELCSVTLGDNVRLVGERAFVGCGGIRCVNVGRGIQKIGASAFFGCECISSVYIYDIVNWCGISFGDYQANPIFYAEKYFIDDSAVTELSFPEQIKEIKPCAFANSKRLTSINIHGNIKTIGEYAFYSCENVTKITIDEGAENIERYAFSRCNKITTINLPTSIKKIGHNAFAECRTLEKIDIPEGVKELGHSVFSACRQLKDVSLPGSLERLGNFVFQCCDELICYGTDKAKYLGNEKNPFIVLIAIKDKTVQKLDINAKTKFIADNTFSHCERLKAITIPSGVIGIGELAFRGCTSLKKVNIKGKLCTIGRAAFENCKSLTSFDIPDSVKDIKESYHIFKGCTSLERVKIGDGVTKLPVGIFEGCTALDTVELGRGIMEFHSRDFKNSTSLRGVKLKNTGWWLSYGALSPNGKAVERIEKTKPSLIAEFILKYPKGYFYTDDALSLSLPDFRI